MYKKFTRTAPKYSSEELALLKIDELISLMKEMAAQLETNTAIDADMKAKVDAVRKTDDEII